VAFAAVDVFLRINGHAITADSKAVYNHFIKLLEQRTFDMEHLVPWMQEIVVATN
jgi:death on curing protein